MEINSCEKFVCSYDKKYYTDHIRLLKQALNHGLKLKKIHRVLKFDRRPWLKECIDVNTEFRKNAENDFEKYFYKLMNNTVYGKTMENVRKCKIIKLAINYAKRKKLASEPNYHTTKWFSENLLGTETKKTSTKSNKPINLGLAILSLSKIKMYEYWHDEMKPKYGDRIKLCYMDTDSFIMHIKTEDFYKDIANDVEKKYDTSNYTVERPLPMDKNKKVIGLMKDELGRKIMREFIGLRPKCYSYLKDDRNVDKKSKRNKKLCDKKIF